ncbi:superoxide dismutase [Aliidiomarina minuta]|uniref:Superoxide dismutase n=1 Tax=Aliidiomarina minuta TaxID=880057 RepID=A0A432WA91_9GAMM|nr:superoxide dismutase [Aliidiomarina minuta]RUO26896.1 superoxide dismutase [Aliidiomarina minuta]
MLRTLSITLASAVCLFAAPALSDAFEQAPLPYASNALEPIIDQQTMEIHFGRHHAAYINNLNSAVAETSELQELSLEDMMHNVSNYSVQVRNNGGGHYNHTLFWDIMAPVDEGGEPSSSLREAIEHQFGSLDEMQSEFNSAAASRFGSGWAWLIVNEQGELQVTSTPNQDNPLMDVVDDQGTPILALDVWEHAYYLQYQNRRGDYSEAWWQLVNWNKVNELYEEAING